MKTSILVYSTAALLLVTVNLCAEESGTNPVHRSCCIPTDAPAKPLKDKSLYQLNSSWTNDDGKTIQLSSLRGRPQVVVMFFASCQLTCPLTVVQLKQLEAALPPKRARESASHSSRLIPCMIRPLLSRIIAPSTPFHPGTGQSSAAALTMCSIWPLSLA